MSRGTSHNTRNPNDDGDHRLPSSKGIALSSSERSTQSDTQSGSVALQSVERVTIMGETMPIRAVIFEEGGFLVAQCLEYDIGAQASNIEDLRIRVMAAIDMECSASIEIVGEPFAGIPQAPKRFFDRWDSGYELEGQTEPSVIETSSSSVEVSYKLAA